MFLFLLRGKILPATLFKLARVVKLRLQFSVVSRGTLNVAGNGCQRTYASLGGLTKERNNTWIRNFFWLGLIRRVYLRQHGLGRFPSRSASLVARRCPSMLTRIVVEAIVFLFCTRITTTFRIQSLGSGTEPSRLLTFIAVLRSASS